MSPMTVYSPSFEAGNSMDLSLIWKSRQGCRRRRRCRSCWVAWCAQAVLKKEFVVVLADGSGRLRTHLGSHPQII